MQCTIISKKALTQTTFDFWIEFPKNGAVSGQFIHILTDTKTLRRPISICEIKDDTIRFIMEVVGSGTAEIAEKKVGDSLDVLGPLGKGFAMIDGKALVVGGGIGVFPLYDLTKKLKDYDVILGFRDESRVVMQDEFQNAYVTTDDGSIGRKGFVTDIMKELISSNKYETVYACGPKAMIENVAKVAMASNIPCQVSMEERMACGIGACVGCVTPLAAGGYACVCKDGPVFDAKELSWI